MTEEQSKRRLFPLIYIVKFLKKSLLIKKNKTKQTKVESDVTVKLPFFDVNQLLVYLLKQPFFSTLLPIEVEQSLNRLTIRV